jgi:hypothetical protein
MLSAVSSKVIIVSWIGAYREPRRSQIVVVAVLPLEIAGKSVTSPETDIESGM